MKTLFKRFGLNAKEIKTFLKMLELGAQPISVLARHVGTPRSTMYLIVEELKRTHLIEEFERAGIKYVKAIPVVRIADVLKVRKTEIDQTTQLLEEKLPELEALENKLSITPKVKFYEGKEAVMKMYEAILKEKEFVAMFNPEFVKRVMPEYHFKIPEAIKQEKLTVRELLIDGPEACEYKNRFDSDHHQIRMLPKGMSFASDTIIAGERIYMISYGEKDLSAIEIWNASLADTQRVTFEELWAAT
jgi:sugar-specific transcriptional regulator TrmB